MPELRPWPWVTVWGILGGPRESPWTRPATDADLEHLGIDKATLGERPDTEGRWV